MQHDPCQWFHTIHRVCINVIAPHDATRCDRRGESRGGRDLEGSSAGSAALGCLHAWKTTLHPVERNLRRSWGEIGRLG
jgi:hypothetical protein